MKVLLIHQHANTHGSGAVIAAYRLHRGLQRAGHQSTIACRVRRLDGADVVELPSAPRLERAIQTVTWRLGLNDIHCLSTFKLASFPAFLDADVVNIHGWHTNFFNYLALPRLSRVRPIVATLHDMWNFTGHCAFSGGCERWRTGCGQCPDLDTFPPVARDATAMAWKLKRRAYRRSAMRVVSPSRAIADMASEGIMGCFPVEQINNAVDIEAYAPRDRDACRRELDLPLDRPVILFVSMSLTDHRKGGDLLCAALERMPESLRADVLLLALGDHGDELADACGVEVRTLGYVRDEDAKVIAYNAADVLVLPSRYENQSLVMIESMACGLAPVTFDVGGLGEVVVHDETGKLAPPEDVDAFSAGIVELLTDHAERTRISAAARDRMCREHALDRHVEQYVACYQKAIDDAS